VTKIVVDELINPQSVARVLGQSGGVTVARIKGVVTVAADVPEDVLRDAVVAARAGVFPLEIPPVPPVALAPRVSPWLAGFTGGSAVVAVVEIVRLVFGG
jgi:hypothetical protein